MDLSAWSAGQALHKAHQDKPNRDLPLLRCTLPAIFVWVLGLTMTVTQAAPVYLPQSANLTYGDVTHGQRVLSASSNPAAAAADVVRRNGKSTSGTVLSVGGGIEYGNMQEIFDKIDQIAQAFRPSEPGSGGDAPGQAPEDKPDDGIDIDIGDIIDQLDPDTQEALNKLGKEILTRTALLAIIKNEGYGKAFISADAPFVIGQELLGGAWTFGINWSGTSKSFGLVQDIQFDPDIALQAIEEIINLTPADPPREFDLSGDILLKVDPATNSIKLSFTNDSSMITKASKTTEIGLGYSRQVWAGNAGGFFLGARLKAYLMELSRYSVRFGDITDSDELFDSIRNSKFESDNEFGIDIGAMWLADNYQIGIQLINLNQPEFEFPRVDLSPYKDNRVISFLLKDRRYTMERQAKLEASLFTTSRRWTVNLGMDINATPDPMGDDFQWFTISGGYLTESWWLPGARIGYRKNMTGTKLEYLSAGATIFKIVNIDMASTFDTVTINGDRLPRGLMASVGFQIAW
ncbi:MAG TPA: type IX secretion system membrane protein PorP/SprF [Gammaproteobacteria bacterium]|nr:type IX secretion system membrane protein PorP/SprF [Gammaproteobacteria bacterium]